MCSLCWINARTVFQQRHHQHPWNCWRSSNLSCNRIIYLTHRPSHLFFSGSGCTIRLSGHFISWHLEGKAWSEGPAGVDGLKRLSGADVWWGYSFCLNKQLTKKVNSSESWISQVQQHQIRASLVRWICLHFSLEKYHVNVTWLWCLSEWGLKKLFVTRCYQIYWN